MPIRVLEDGEGATLMIAAAEIGQGSETVLLQVATEALGLVYGDVTMADCDSEISPIDLGSYSSRVTLMAGNAVKAAMGASYLIVALSANAAIGYVAPAIGRRRTLIPSGLTETAAPLSSEAILGRVEAS